MNLVYIKLVKIPSLPDSELRELIDDVTLVTQGELFSLARINAIWRLLTNFHSNLNFDKYIDPKIWIPLTESVDLLELENWDTKFQLDNRPYWIERQMRRHFNGNLKIISQIPKQSSLIWVGVNWGYTYDIYVNSEMIYTIDKHNHCHENLKNLSQRRNIS